MLPRERAVRLWLFSPLHLFSLTLPHYLAKHRNTKIPFSTVRCFFSSILLTCSSCSHCCRLPKSCNRLSSALACGGRSSGEMKLRVLHSSCWTVLRTTCTGTCMSCVAERQMILSSTTCLITANICWDSNISHQYCPLTFHLRLDKEQLPLLTQRSTSWHSL